MEEEMANFKMSHGDEYVLTLKQLKRKYPEGDDNDDDGDDDHDEDDKDKQWRRICLDIETAEEKISRR